MNLNDPQTTVPQQKWPSEIDATSKWVLLSSHLPLKSLTPSAYAQLVIIFSPK